MSVSSSPSASSNDTSPETEKSPPQESSTTTSNDNNKNNNNNDDDDDDDVLEPAETESSRIQREAYETTRELLQKRPVLLAPITAVVGLRPAVQDPPHEEEVVAPSLLTPNRGHHALFRALEDLEGLEKQEAELLLQNPLTAELTTVVTGEDYPSSRRAVDTLETLCRTVPRRVCQHPFKKNDIVWVCRTCQADETCVLCHNCFTQSNHEGHDVAFYHAQAGGCCDCGDPDAWDPRGFCPHHGPASLRMTSEGGATMNLGPLNSTVLTRVEGVVPATIDWMVENIARAAEDGYARTDEEEPPFSVTDGEELPVQQQVSRTTTVTRAAAEDDVEIEEDPMGMEASPMLLDDDESISTTNAVFSPAAAGSSTRLRLGLAHGSVSPGIVPEPQLQPLVESQPGRIHQHELTKAERLGILAREGGGLYLVLKSDDIHTSPQLIDALRDLLGTSSLYTESILQKVVRALKQFGQLVVWGTMELLAELSLTQVRLWLDGDRVASGVLGRAVLNRSSLLTSHGLFCCILTRDELLLEQRAVAVLQWLTGLARSCDPLCQKVAESISPDRHLVPLLRADFKLSSRVTKYWHSLLLTLLAVPAFKSHLAAAYCDTYQLVTAEYARGMGVLERSGYALSVQFLNRVTYVVDLVQRRDLLGKLGASLYETLHVAAVPLWNASLMQQPNQSRLQHCLRLNPNHFVLTHRRYSPCISDLKCVLNVKGMPRLFGSKSGSFLNDWIASLALGQMMDPQVWRNWNEDHVELEVRGWVGAFNASISLGSLFERLLSWDDDDQSPIQDPNSPLSSNLMSCVELTLHVLVAGINEWQTLEMKNHEATSFSASIEPYKRRSASLPFSTISVKHGSVLAFQAIPMSQDTPFSFHLPLHRFVATCLRETCLRQSGIADLKIQLAQNLPAPVYENLFLGLMEFPLLVLSRAAQIRAGLWRRNGNGLNDQVLNYAEPPFCRAMRDADLLLVQFAVLGRTKNQTTDYRPDTDVGVCFMVHLLLHRLGLFDFCGLAKAPNVDINRYLDEVQKGLYSSEKSSEEMGDDFLLPWTCTPAIDAASCLLLLEEFLHTMIVLCTELPPIPPSDKVDHTSQAKWRLKREVIHRLASGPKTHSELAEVHHVLSHWDNVYLSEEGKLLNPDDATGAALGAVLSEVATRKVSRGKMEPDKWELSRSAWESYDPSFYHINLRNHQTAAESRPNLESGEKELFRVKAKSMSPPLPVAHQDFVRLRRDITSDATILAITYRTLHMHIRDTKRLKGAPGLRGSLAYEEDDRSETAVARAVHLLTLGAFAWQGATGNNKEWRNEGGGSIGSVFFDRSDDAPAPTAREWISAALLANPRTQQASEWYGGEENCLQLLRRLAVEGGYEGCFVAQDRAVQAGAAWLCEFAANHNSEASKSVYLKVDGNGMDDDAKIETEAEKRRRIAKQKAMDRMKAQAAKFASMMQTELGGNDDDEATVNDDTGAIGDFPPRPVDRQGSFASGSSVASTSDSDKAAFSVATDLMQGVCAETLIPPRLLKTRPQCIICSDDGTTESKLRDREEDGHRKSRRRRNDGGNALAFVGYTQASTVLKGGGGPPWSGNFYSSFVPVTRFVGAHVALCGHAIHSECWESYLATVSHREDRVVGKRDEFRCPLCQRLSNCLVPFIDVGVDWIECEGSESSTREMELRESKSADGLDSMSIESQELSPVSLEKFLASTPWWVCRHNDGVSWDGQCAFVSNHVESTGNADQSSVIGDHMEEVSTAPSSVPRRRSVRALRKKDLYATWNAMMKTPRYVRRKLRPKAVPSSDGTITFGDSTEFVGVQPVSSSESSGETVVWRRFMDQVSDITYRADGKRLGDENLHNDFGEFRHYIAEKYAYNLANRFAGKEPSDWPSCVFPSSLSETQRQELSREKLLSKLMMSVQAFTYSVACEAHEARRLSRKVKKLSGKSAGYASNENSLISIFSQYGISNIVCDGRLVVMPRPSAAEDDGSQPFNGRLGRLRYIGLAVMAAAGALAADIVQLVLAFPTQQTSNASVQPFRAPIVYPILHGHVVTHVVAAICASAGRARARSDSLELVWPVPFTSKGSFVASDSFGFRMSSDSVFDDAEGFVKLGLLARIQQVLLGKLDIEGLPLIAGFETESIVLKTIKSMRAKVALTSSLESRWKLNCLTLLEMVLSEHNSASDYPESPHVESAIIDRFDRGCQLAAEAACCYLADIGVVLQLVLPGMMARYSPIEIDDELHDSSSSSCETLGKLEKAFRLEPLSEILQSGSVQSVVSTWYKTALDFSKASLLPGAAISGSGVALSNRLFQTQGFRIFDWPMDSSADDDRAGRSGGDAGGVAKSSADDSDETYPMQIDQIQAATPQGGSHASNRPQLPSPLVTFSSKKSVKLIGGYSISPLKSSGRPRISRLPTSYTDLYAELSRLLPESEQTAVCLICGEVLNAAGKGECTKHSYKCGAGTGLFFLLQECVGLIMHNGKAAYIHSPYVDSHGETPQYRGRPLNLDLDRYAHLHEVWSGHAIRQQVLTERAGSKQIIVLDFY